MIESACKRVSFHPHVIQHPDGRWAGLCLEWWGALNPQVVSTSALQPDRAAAMEAADALCAAALMRREAEFDVERGKLIETLPCGLQVRSTRTADEVVLMLYDPAKVKTGPWRGGVRKTGRIWRASVHGVGGPWKTDAGALRALRAYAAREYGS